MSSYTDVGASVTNQSNFNRAVQTNFQQFFDMFASLHLPSGYTLEVEIVELDLAGEVRGSPTVQNTRRHASTLPPSMVLTWELQDVEGKVVAGSENEQLIDRNHLTRVNTRNTAFRYEMALIEDWFVGTIRPQVAT